MAVYEQLDRSKVFLLLHCNTFSILGSNTGGLVNGISYLGRVEMGASSWARPGGPSPGARQLALAASAKGPDQIHWPALSFDKSRLSDLIYSYHYPTYRSINQLYHA